MELNLIREDKLKVLLTPFDMMKYELTCETLDYDNTETRKAIWNILDYAKHETGFDAAIGKIRIEVYPEKSGGCAIYITKLKKSELPSSDSMTETTGPSGIAQESCAVYQFEDSESLLRVCRFLMHRGYDAESAAFFETSAKTGVSHYFLKIMEKGAYPGKKTKYLKENLFIAEFGKKLEYKEASHYLYEHCTELCTGNAVQTLSLI